MAKSVSSQIGTKKRYNYRHKLKSRSKMYKKKQEYKIVPLSVKKYVKSIISKDKEIKMAGPYRVSNNVIGTLNSSTPGDISWFFTQILYPLQTIAQGVEVDERIGNEIIMKSARVRGVISLVSSGTTTGWNDQGIATIMVFYRHDYSSPTTALIDLYQSGNVTRSPTGRITDMLEDYNEDVYKVIYSKQFKMGTSTSYNNNDYKLTQMFEFDLVDLGFKDYKVKYDDAVAAPTDAKLNYLYLAAVWSNADGTQVGSGGGASGYTSKFDVSLITQVKYTDS